LRSDQVRETDPWARGVVLSFDFVTKDLKDYYSKNSPQGAYEVLKRFLLKNGFEYLRDSDYKNKFMDKVDTVDLLYSFSRDHKWFPHCINKVNISPNITALDISNDIKALGDEDWKKEKDAENAGKSQEKQAPLSEYKNLIEKARLTRMTDKPDIGSDGKKMENER